MKTFRKFNMNENKNIDYRGKTIISVDDKFYVYDIDKFPSDTIEDTEIKIDKYYNYYNTEDINFSWDED